MDLLGSPLDCRDEVSGELAIYTNLNVLQHIRLLWKRSQTCKSGKRKPMNNFLCFASPRYVGFGLCA